MIQQRLILNNKPLEMLLQFLSDAPKIINKELQATLDDVKEPALEALREQPGAVKYPIEWTSEKQRKAFFASDGFGAGIPTTRTGDLAAAWEFNLEANTFVIRNRNSAAPYVYGSLAKSNPGKYQQRFHVNTGWKTEVDTVNYWLNAARETFVIRMTARLGEAAGKTAAQTQSYVETRTRAYTRR